MTKKAEQKPQIVPRTTPRTTISSQQDKLDKRLSTLESQALSLEERAKYAEKEAALRARIQGAKRRIQATQPPGLLDNLLPGLAGVFGVWKRIPTPARVLFVLVGIVVVLLLIGNAMSGGG